MHDDGRPNNNNNNNIPPYKKRQNFKIREMGSEQLILYFLIKIKYF
jgi:hypothetical protein